MDSGITKNSMVAWTIINKALATKDEIEAAHDQNKKRLSVTGIVSGKSGGVKRAETGDAETVKDRTIMVTCNKALVDKTLLGALVTHCQGEYRRSCKAKVAGKGGHQSIEK